MAVVEGLDELVKYQNDGFKASFRAVKPGLDARNLCAAMSVLE